MKINEAKEIPLSFITEHFGGRYSHTDRYGDLWYFSPFRPAEKTASFKISTKTNKWHDFGLAGIIIHTGQSKKSSGGDPIDLWCDFHRLDRRAGFKQAIDGLSAFLGSVPKITPVRFQNPAPHQGKPPRYKILSINDRITHPGLKDELYKRRISPRVANIYLKQGSILDTVTERKYIGFLFENDKDGHEVSIPNPKSGQCFKTCIGPKSSSFLEPQKETHSVDVFEGFWDFLSWLEIKKIQIPMNYTFVMNSVSFTGEVSEKIVAMNEQASSVFLFMDNDIAGEAATHEIALLLESEAITVGDMRNFYKSKNDLNLFWSS